MQLLDVNFGFSTAIAAKGFGSVIEQLVLPIDDLVLMKIELLGKLSQGLIAFECSDSHFSLKGR